jgi:transposase
MNRAIPAITERPEVLKALLKAERAVKRAQRIQMLYLFASKQVHTRRAAAAALGVHRETVGAWLECYASGGLAALLTCYVPPGKTPRVTPAIEAELRALLGAPQRFSSYQAIVDWLWQQHQIQLSYSAVYALVRQKLRVRLSVRGGSHGEQPYDIAKHRVS